jgi:hypothetical protein
LAAAAALDEERLSEEADVVWLDESDTELEVLVAVELTLLKPGAELAGADEVAAGLLPPPPPQAVRPKTRHMGAQRKARGFIGAPEYLWLLDIAMIIVCNRLLFWAV